MIINNIDFEPATRQAKRFGAEHDTTRLTEMYTLLGFQVRSYTNLTTTEMLTVLNQGIVLLVGFSHSTSTQMKLYFSRFGQLSLFSM